MYLDLSVAGGRRVLNPLPLHLGGDVLASSDPELGPPAREAADPREDEALALLGDLRGGGDVADDLARLGVRWVVLLHEVDWQPYAGLRHRPGLEVVVDGPTLELLRVARWRGPAVDPGGGVHRLAGPVDPLRPDGPDPATTWYRAGQDGWLQGRRAASVGDDGHLELPGGGGPVWFWPALVVLAADVATGAAVVAAVRGRPRAAPADDG
jgi:hypothetical protein